MNNNLIMDNNRNYWNENADLWFGTTALPEYGVKFVTEDDWISPKSSWIMRKLCYQKMDMPQS